MEGHARRNWKKRKRREEGAEYSRSRNVLRARLGFPFGVAYPSSRPWESVSFKWLAFSRHRRLQRLLDSSSNVLGAVPCGRKYQRRRVAYIGGRTEVEALDLDGTRITDSGLSHLGGMKGLRSLSLGRTRTTDGGLEQLQRQMLPDLENLWLHGTRVTDGGPGSPRRDIQSPLPVSDELRREITDAGLEELGVTERDRGFVARPQQPHHRCGAGVRGPNERTSRHWIPAVTRSPMRA